MILGFMIAVFFVAIVLFGVFRIVSSQSLNISNWILSANQALQSGDYDSAEDYYIRLSRIRPTLHDPHRQAEIEFIVEHGFGFCYFHRGDMVTADLHLTRAAKLLDEGVVQPRYVFAHLMASLAVVYFTQGKQPESQQALKRTGEICEEADESEILQIAELVTAAAHGAARRNHNELAFEIATIAQSILERTENWHDSALAHIQIALASFHMRHCEYGPARELIESAMKNAGDELDRQDERLAYSFLGWIATLSGEPEAAIRAFEHERELLAEEYDEADWRTSVPISALADAYRMFGKYDEARRYSDWGWKIKCEQLSEDDSVRGSGAANRAMLLIDFGEFDEADALLRYAAEVAQRQANRVNQCVTRLFQGISARAQLDYRRAEKILQAARSLAEELYGLGHRMTCDYLAIQGANLIRLGRYTEAEQILNETLAIRESLSDNSVTDLADLHGIFAELYIETDRISEADASLQRVLELVDDCLADTHLIRAATNETLGRIRHAQADLESAIDHFRTAAEIRDRVQRPEHPSRVRLLEAYARSLESMGENAQAEAQRSRAEAIRKTYCGE